MLKKEGSCKKGALLSISIIKRVFSCVSICSRIKFALHSDSKHQNCTPRIPQTDKFERAWIVLAYSYAIFNATKRGFSGN